MTYTTLGRTPLEEGSVRRTDLYPTTHNNQNGERCKPAAEFEPAIPANERPHTDTLDSVTTGIDRNNFTSLNV